MHDGSGGELDWTARSLVDWIEVTQHETYCELRLRPKPGMNRGSVHVHAARGGGSKVVRVVVEVRRRDDAPSVTVTPEELDFGVLGRASESRPQTLRIKKSTPELEVTATAEEPWIDVEQDGDVVTVSVDTGTAGDLAGKIAVRSDAGEILVPVRAVVEQGPVLEVDPPKIDFGRATEGRRVEATIRILNSGSGELTWRHRKSGAFFSTERAADTLTVTLYAVPGSHVGSISIRSNGGDAVIEVRARVTPRRASQPRRKSAVAGSTAASGKESATSGNAAAKRATARKKPVRPTQAKAKQEPAASTGSRTPVRKQAQAKPQRAKPTPPSRSIKELLAALGPAPPPVAVEYTLEILGALKVTHALGQANGRISSTGVVVDGAGAVTVPAPFQPAEARPDPRYRAPEQRSGNAATPRSDIYSVATILYELLTGHLPSAGDRLGGRFPAPSKQRDGVPAAVDSVVLRALARDPSRRYRDAQEMAEAVLQVQASVKKHGPAQAALLASRYPRRRAAARDATGAAAAATPTRIGERRVSGLFFAERELDADEAIAWRAIVASFEVAGWLALPPTRGRVARNQSHVVMTNKRLFLAASFERATRPLRVSVPWSSITAVECVDESHDTGKWIFKERKERARVDVRVSLAPLVGPPLVQTTRPRARQPPSLTLRSHPELTIVGDTLALGQTIRDQIARRARV